MQRSRKALQQRRDLKKAIGRNHLYKVSLSLVIILWGLVFLLNSWIGHGDAHQDESRAPALNVSSWDESKLGTDAASDTVHEHPLSSLENKHLNETCAEYAYETSCYNSTIVKEASGEVQSGENTLNNTSTDVTGSADHVEVETVNSDLDHREGTVKTERLTRTVPRGLDEFKKKAFNSKNAHVPGATGSVIHRMEPGGGVYNYASAAKGAKVLDSNKEAKGASNILNKDKDKYLRNPCSAEGKFVVIELSEETLVDTIKIANFEHYSSNLKDFELLGSQVYPTQTWVKLGNFSAGNVKHAQSFALIEPKWVRYLKLNILSHYGSEHYCTLSSVEVYGVDAVEKMLEDLIAVPDHHHYANGEPADEQELTQPVAEPAESNSPDQNPSSESETEEDKNLKHDETNNANPDPVEEVRHPQISRMPGDTVLKILMQKVRALDLSLSVLERYLEEVNSRYASIFKEFDKEMEEKELLLEKTRLDIKNALDSRDVIAKDVDDLVAWRSLVSMQLDGLLKDNAILRSDVRKVQEKQLYMESKGIVVFLMSVIFSLFALAMLFTDIIVNSVYIPEKSRKFCLMKSSWFFLFLSCSTTIVILSL